MLILLFIRDQLYREYKEFILHIVIFYYISDRASDYKINTSTNMIIYIIKGLYKFF